MKNLHTKHNIKIELSDRDLWYLEYGDPTGMHTGAVLDELYKRFPDILDYRNSDVLGTVRCIIRLQCLRKDTYAMPEIIRVSSKCVSPMEFHAFLHAVNGVDLDVVVCDIMNTVDLRDTVYHNINHLTRTIRGTRSMSSVEMLEKFKCLSVISEHAIRASSILFTHRIPVYAYEADVNYLCECVKLAESIPVGKFMLGFNDIISVHDDNIDAVRMRTVILKSLQDADLLDIENVEKVLCRRHKMRCRTRSFECLESGNAAYVLLELLSRYKLLTPTVFYSIAESISRISEGAVLDFSEIISEKIPPHVLNPIVARTKESRVHDLAIRAKVDIMEDAAL